MMSSSTTAIAQNAVKIGKLIPQRTTFFLCDIQERFRPLIYHSETIIHTARYLTSVADVLQIPIISTQQYTKVFGSTVSDCFASEEIQRNVPVFEKKKFSMLTEEVKKHYFEQQQQGDVDRTSVVLFGIEAHVCVMQTCLDLLEVSR